MGVVICIRFKLAHAYGSVPVHDRVNQAYGMRDLRDDCPYIAKIAVLLNNVAVTDDWGVADEG
jgi:hypothetical protein